jgi:hypothetical protein
MPHRRSRSGCLLAGVCACVRMCVQMCVESVFLFCSLHSSVRQATALGLFFAMRGGSGGDATGSPARAASSVGGDAQPSPPWVSLHHVECILCPLEFFHFSIAITVSPNPVPSGDVQLPRTLFQRHFLFQPPVPDVHQLNQQHFGLPALPATLLQALGWPSRLPPDSAICCA